jgi:hypothetical protein
MTGAGVTASIVAALAGGCGGCTDPCERRPAGSWALSAPGAARSRARRGIPRRSGHGVSVPRQVVRGSVPRDGGGAEHRARLVRARGTADAGTRPGGRSAGRSSSARCAVGSGVTRSTPVVPSWAGRARSRRVRCHPRHPRPGPGPVDNTVYLPVRGDRDVRWPVTGCEAYCAAPPTANFGGTGGRRSAEHDPKAGSAEACGQRQPPSGRCRPRCARLEKAGLRRPSGRGRSPSAAGMPGA